MDLAFSHPIGFMKQGEDVSTIIESLTALFGITRILTTFPELQRFLNLKWVYRFLASKPSDDHGPGMIRGVAINEVKRRLQQGVQSKEKDLLDRFLEYKDETGNGFPRRDLEVESFTPVIAGPESVATILRVAVIYIIGTPRVYRKLQAEIDENRHSGTISTPVSTPFPRTVPPEGANICGYFLPGGCDVGFSMWALGRNKTVFGEDVDCFRPERWFDTKEKIASYEKADLTFSAGLTTCLGRHIAMFEIHKTLFELFRNFEINLADPFVPCVADNILTFLVHDMPVYLNPRPGSN
ncbi:hypothetical protein PENPOL_c026G05066 [Penicillium polonicum]|uniref:Cytochrome P450 n=1 Tax=Penicillium polonicum TaxID=60169 RepID=A0A1V6N6A6_PENPO|nr:hypothetical protein PENPOL_c026G05066 [Penicillium polonicum]